MKINRYSKLSYLLLIPLCALLIAPSPQTNFSKLIKGPLRVHPRNPRYFTDDGIRAVYLTGSHTWSNLSDIWPEDSPNPFPWNAYLDFLQKHNHNFIRLWRWEFPKFQFKGMPVFYAEPQPWARTGPGVAKDGKPKYDLTKFNEAYFRRLRARVESAQKRGIYVSIMLFIWGEFWEYHPFNTENNINGINSNQRDYYTLKDPKVLALQEAYVKKVIDTVNDLDNVLYEICNETDASSTEWQYHLIRFIKDYESKKPKQHPVGMTIQAYGGRNATLFNSPADWISPNPEGGYRDDPPPNDGRKVVLNDTDHLWGEGGNPQWVWKSFMRGHNPIFMDRIVELTKGLIPWSARPPAKDIPQSEEIRKAMGVTRRLADRIELAKMFPKPELASTKYCLANPRKEYLVYLPPHTKEVQVDLSRAEGTLNVEWIHPIEGTTISSGTIKGGKVVSFTNPTLSDAVLHIFRRR
ncbi:cellulase family glycosylhydrolase [bacterium]|nr:cellulase family glycosylhydrolase [bacterium]